MGSAQRETWNSIFSESKPFIKTGRLSSFNRLVYLLIRNRKSKINNHMLYTIAIVFLVLWGLGLISSYTMGGFIHILLVCAIVMVLVRFIQGRR
jgi:hypothetical protein